MEVLWEKKKKIMETGISLFLMNTLYNVKVEPHSSVSGVQDIKVGGCWFAPRFRPIFFPGIDDSHLGSIHSSLTPLFCQWLCGIAANELEGIVCGVLIHVRKVVIDLGRMLSTQM